MVLYFSAWDVPKVGTFTGISPFGLGGHPIVRQAD